MTKLFDQKWPREHSPKVFDDFEKNVNMSVDVQQKWGATPMAATAGYVGRPPLYTLIKPTGTLMTASLSRNKTNIIPADDPDNDYILNSIEIKCVFQWSWQIKWYFIQIPQVFFVEFAKTRVISCMIVNISSAACMERSFFLALCLSVLRRLLTKYDTCIEKEHDTHGALIVLAVF